MAGNPESHDRAMIILQAPSPGGPVDVFEVPETEEGQIDQSRIDQESSLDVANPSSSSPAPAPPEAWRNWKPKDFAPQTSERTLPETRTIRLKAAGSRWETLDYNPQQIRHAGACKNMASHIQEILQGSPYEKTVHSKCLLGILKKIGKV